MSSINVCRLAPLIDGPNQSMRVSMRSGHQLTAQGVTQVANIPYKTIDIVAAVVNALHRSFIYDTYITECNQSFN